MSFVTLLTTGYIIEKRRKPAPEIVIETIATEKERSSEWDGLWEETAAAMAIVTTDHAGGLININTASARELGKLPGIGDKTAEAIVEYREKTPFQSIEDIMNVSGIGEKKFEDIKDKICV